MPIDHGRPWVKPVTEQDSTKIAVGSPIAIQGIFMEVIRERFRTDAGLAWAWDPDITKTGIVIEGSYNEETESKNTSPAIYITRLDTTPAKIALGDRGTHRLPDSREEFTALNTTSMQIECVSNDEGESSVIADITQYMLICSQDLIQRQFGLHDFTMPSMGQTTPYARDENKWSTPLQFQIQWQSFWRTTPVANLLQQVMTRITQSGQEPNEYFVDIMTNSLSRSRRGP